MIRHFAARVVAVLGVTALLLTAAGQVAVADMHVEPDEELPIVEQTDLVLLLDGSGSISATDWDLQLDGYAAALQDRVNVPLDNSVAVSVVQ
ncbi:DUF1194 domain-containing protein [Agromyces sp. S2-1-8]|nr:DUF1194 domain-containing protein [Agromyces sp. S2-1-8]MCD5345743.1 DUF1194 domain-containing protein [Agromyces sp. S2-1-8]